MHFSVLGSSRCQVLSVLDLRVAFYLLRLLRNSKRYCGIVPYFGNASYLYQRMAMGLNISHSIWQSYINAILECLQSRKYCEAIMDDLLSVHSIKEITHSKIRRLIKGFTKEWT